MVEGARLESVYTGNRIAGSNPASSANRFVANSNKAHCHVKFLAISKGFSQTDRTSQTGAQVQNQSENPFSLVPTEPRQE